MIGFTFAARRAETGKQRHEHQQQGDCHHTFLVTRHSSLVTFEDFRGSPPTFCAKFQMIYA
jgi:hypothetical protein